MSDSPREAPPVALVVYGASGDLTARKLVPALADLAAEGRLPAQFGLVGVARTELSDDDFRARIVEATGERRSECWDDIVAAARYVVGDYTEDETFSRLDVVLREIDDDRGTTGNRLHYLATVPSVFGSIATALGRHGMNGPAGDGTFCRLVIEKPYGHDLASAQALDAEVHAVFSEEQIYRIDHYLGKETVLNVLALRFANAIFEPVWNRRYVDHVEITVAESIGVGHRASFYEGAGALRDIVQNHVLQVLALTVMEPPSSIDATGIRDEKVKALRAVDHKTADELVNDVVRARYGPGTVDGEAVPGYLDEEGVDPASTTETYLAMQFAVDNWRWAGVPFFVRTGKRLPKRVTEVAMTFNAVPHLPFLASEARGLEKNTLILRIQPDEGITLKFGAKVPGQEFEVRTVAMEFDYTDAFSEDPPDAYERLLLDAMVGDPTLFIRADEVEEAWRIVDPVLEAAADDRLPVHDYAAGTWGPAEADRLLSRSGRRWRRP